MEMIWNVAATLFFLSCFAALTLRWLAFSGAAIPAPLSDPLPIRTGETPAGRTLVLVFAAALLYRLLYALASLLLFNILSDIGVGIAELPELWSRWDGRHYIQLVRLGYGGYLEEGQPLFLVFYPLYVWLTRGLSLLIPDIPLAGMVVSGLCFAGGCVFFFRLAAEEYGVRIARRSLVLLAAFPFSFFFGGIMTESLFFLTTAAGLYYIRRHRWALAAVWGILAAMTRMQGVILVGAAVAELTNQLRPFAFRGRERRNCLLTILKRLPLLCAPVLGSLSYLLLNYHVTGDPFAFTRMQQHWSQGFCWFPEVLAYLTKHALTWPTVSTRWEMWIPELVLFPVFALLLWRSWKRHRSMFTLYGTVYFILSYCLSWLLSAGRYLSCCLPCFLFAADLLEEKPRRTAVLVLAMAILQGVLLYRYFCWGQVM